MKQHSRGSLNIPGVMSLPQSNSVLPHVIVADDAFPLRSYIMKPYPFRSQTPQPRIFSYRLCRARRTVENAFGILCNKFRVLLNPINLPPNTVEKVVLACLCLHNILQQTTPGYTSNSLLDAENIEQGVVIEGAWRQQGGSMIGLRSVGRNPTSDAKLVRNEYCSYFNP